MENTHETLSEPVASSEPKLAEEEIKLGDTAEHAEPAKEETAAPVGFTNLV
jgi:hypothetical protein